MSAPVGAPARSRVTRRPVPRWRVLAALCVCGLAVAALVWGLELLRFAPEQPGPVVIEPGRDPREPTECQVREPREGAQRVEPQQPGVPLVGSGLLLACPYDYEGNTVRVRGEVVGGVLDRGDGAWVQVNDDAYGMDVGPLPVHRRFLGGNSGIGVWVPPAAADEIAAGGVGGPGRRGTVVEVTGTFQRVDRQSGEVSVVRAQLVDVVSPGEPLDVPAHPRRWLVAGPLAALALGLVLVERRRALRR